MFVYLKQNAALSLLPSIHLLKSPQHVCWTTDDKTGEPAHRGRMRALKPCCPLTEESKSKLLIVSDVSKTQLLCFYIPKLRKAVGNCPGLLVAVMGHSTSSVSVSISNDTVNTNSITPLSASPFAAPQPSCLFPLYAQKWPKIASVDKIP